MSSRSLFAVFALVAASFAPGVALAQLPSSGITLSVGGENVPSSNPLFINRNQCRNDKWRFSVTLTSAGNAGMQIPVLEMWVGNNIDCTQSSNRSSLNNNKSPCWLVDTKTAVTINAATTFEVDGNAIFDVPDDGVDGCAEQSPLTFNVAFVPLNQNTRPGTEAPAPLSDVNALEAKFTLYGAVPPSPTNVRGNGGERSLGAKWDGVNAGPNTAYQIYMDVGKGGGPASDAETGDSDAGTGNVSCGSGKLVAGRPPPTVDNKTVFVSDIRKTTDGSIGGLDDKGVAIGDTVAIAVVTRDAAHNLSNLSEVVCVRRDDTSGFWEQCEADPACRNGFDECSAAPWRDARGPLSALVLGAATVALVRRRRRNV